MAGKAVSFAADLGAPPTKQFRTFPKCALKQTRSAKPEESPASPQKSTETLVEDVYFRFHKLKEADVIRCLDSIVDGHCKNVLFSYSVLNSVLKCSSVLDQEEDLGPTGSVCEYDIDNKRAEALLSRACTDLDQFSNSSDVLDGRVLQQIMRAIETLWMRGCISKIAMKPQLASLAAKCVSLVESRPGSKLLLSPAVRVVNIALDESAIEPITAKRFLQALSRTRFVFAASFTAELIVVLTTMLRVQPSVLQENASVWVPLAVRALVSSSSLTRSMALHILVNSDCRNRPDVAQALLRPCDPQRQDSEPLVRFVARKFVALLSASSDDAKLVAESWCLVLESAAQKKGPWLILDHWIEIEHLVLKAAPKCVPVAWSSIIFAQSADPSYCRLLLAPFSVLGNADHTTLSKMFQETLSAVDLKNQEVWDRALFPLFKCMAPKKGPEIRQSGAELASSFALTESNVPAYLEIFTTLFRNVSNQNIPLCEILWTEVVKCSAKSRTRAMEVVRFHYRLLAEDASIVPFNLSLQLSDSLIKLWPFSFSCDRPKNSSFSLLTLILLPVVVSVQSDRQSEYLDKLLANCKNEDAVRDMLSALLSTVLTDSDNQFNKWAVAARIFREYIGESKDPLSASLCCDALTMFLHIAVKQQKQPSAGHWAEWQRLFTAGSAGREKTLARTPYLTAQGLKVLLDIPGYETEKCRIIVASVLHTKEEPSSANPLLTQLKQSSLSSDLLDNTARNLVAKKSVNAMKWALALVASSRVFVIAKPMLELVEETRSAEIVKLWNAKVVPALDHSPAFVSKRLAERLATSIPELTIPSSVVIPSNNEPQMAARTSPKNTSPTPLKRQAPETPPTSSSKRPRRRILTGSIPPSLATPPVSSDPPEESGNSLAPNDDLLCSSPPQRSRTLGGPSQAKEPWRNSQPERARTLKRVMMGLDMDEAVSDMKRSEQEMIYNLLFRSCVKLRTHLAAMGPSLPAADVEAAASELELANQKHQALQDAEEAMIENGRRRAMAEDSQELFSDEDSDLLEDELADTYMPPHSIKLEV